MKRKLSTLCLILALGGLVHAADTKADPTGTWKWSPANPDGRTVEITFTLKLQGETLTGSVARSSGTNPIINGVFRGGEVVFQTVREGKAGKSTTTYRGKLSGDTIKGTVGIDARGKKISDDWEAKRVRKQLSDMHNPSLSQQHC